MLTTLIILAFLLSFVVGPICEIFHKVPQLQVNTGNQAKSVYLMTGTPVFFYGNVCTILGRLLPLCGKLLTPL